MVNVQVNQADIAAEFLDVYKHLDPIIARKIPLTIIYRFRKIRNPNHKVELKEGLEIDEQDIMPETLSLIGYLYTEYCATEEEKQKIRAAESRREAALEALKREKYNPDNIFASNTKETEVKVEEVKTELVPVKESILTKIVNFFKNLFGGKNNG